MDPWISDRINDSAINVQFVGKNDKIVMKMHASKDALFLRRLHLIRIQGLI